MVEHHVEGPGPSLTDQAAQAAFDAVDAKMAELGADPQRVWTIAMVMLQGGGHTNATVAGNLPGGEVTPERMLSYAVHQLEMLAQECGVRLVVTQAGN